MLAVALAAGAAVGGWTELALAGIAVIIGVAFILCRLELAVAVLAASFFFTNYLNNGASVLSIDDVRDGIAGTDARAPPRDDRQPQRRRHHEPRRAYRDDTPAPDLLDLAMWLAGTPCGPLYSKMSAPTANWTHWCAPSRHPRTDPGGTRKSTPSAKGWDTVRCPARDMSAGSEPIPTRLIP